MWGQRGQPRRSVPGAGARVIAIEPVAETAALLRQRLGRNSRLIVLETALGATEGQTIITVSSPHCRRHRNSLPIWMK